MSITTTRLTRGAGLSAVVAGLLFIVIQLVHPHEDVAAVTTFTGGAVVGDVGSLQLASLVAAVGYLLGGLLFGLVLYRARILARWASLLLAVGSVATLLVPVLPHALDRLIAFPVGLALAGLGYSLWREQPMTTQQSPSGLHDARRDPAGVQ